jgi:hypothetical protein
VDALSRSCAASLKHVRLDPQAVLGRASDRVRYDPAGTEGHGSLRPASSLNERPRNQQIPVKRVRIPRGTFGFDHLVDRAAIAGNFDVGHAVNMRPFCLAR